tara:strand:+ start:2343 stop:2642 length:300 start_codon:yes stop_codon:yes gene_type:complete
MSVLLPWILFGTCFIALLISLWYNYKFARIIIKVEDSVSECLELLDDNYIIISRVLEIPIFFDSPQVRQVIDSIKNCRDSILHIANTVAKIEEAQSEED